MTREQGQQFVLSAIIVALVFVLFHFFGVTDLGYDPAAGTHSLFAWVSRRWVHYSETQDDFPYGWIAPLVSIWMVWRMRGELVATQTRVSLAGLGVILFALVLHWAGARAQQTRVSLAAFLLLVWGIPLHLFGWNVARRLLLPTCFLIFSLQFDFLADLSLKFRRLQAEGSAILLNGLGVGTDCLATSLHISGKFIRVTDSPGGLRSMMLAGAGAVVLAWLRQRGPARQIVLLLVVPFAVLIASIARTTLEGLLLARGFQAVENGVTVEAVWSAPFFYAVALGVLWGWHKVLVAYGRSRLRNHAEEAT